MSFSASAGGHTVNKVSKYITGRFHRTKKKALTHRRVRHAEI